MCDGDVRVVNLECLSSIQLTLELITFPISTRKILLVITVWIHTQKSCCVDCNQLLFT